MKRRTGIIVAVITALSMLTLATFAGVSTTEGYEMFKTVLRSNDTEVIKAGTVTGNIEVLDNGVSVIKVEGSINGNHDSEEMSAAFELTSKTLNKNISFYGFEDMIYILDEEKNDVYVGTHKDNENYEKEHFKHDNDKFDEKSEALLDFIVGDLKNEFKLTTDENGQSNIVFELEKSEMPEIVNILTSLKSDNFGHDHDYDNDDKWDMEAYPLFKELQDSNIEMTELVSNVETNYIKIALVLNNENEVEGMNALVEISGLDADSVKHTLTFKLDFEFTARESVEINTIDLDGKNVYELPEENQY